MTDTADPTPDPFAMPPTVVAGELITAAWGNSVVSELANLNTMLNAWTVYTPVVSNSTSTVAKGRYLRFGAGGKTVFVYNMLEIVATYGGTSAITMSPPFPLKGPTAIDAAIGGSGSLDRTTLGKTILVTPFLVSGGGVGALYQGAGVIESSAVIHAAPLNLVVGDYLHWTYLAELA